MNIEIVTPEEYVRPADGFDYCESCNYLTEVWGEYCMDDGSRVVPLCRECFEGLTNNEEEGDLSWRGL